MATKFITLDSVEKNRQKKTVFKKYVSSDFKIKETESTHEDYDNVLFLGNDYYYGDVFKAWLNGREDDFCIFFGEKGDEF